MKGDIADLPAICALKERYDAHCIGVMGATGRGSWAVTRPRLGAFCFSPRNRRNPAWPPPRMQTSGSPFRPGPQVMPGVLAPAAGREE